MNPLAVRAGVWLLSVPILIAALGFGFKGLAAVDSSLFFTWGYFLEVLIAGLL